ncbi:hypothetical protein GF380_06340 [Candidatus Uhrbacteria bacterium]|nr:hypothetical protein [Candidatus Uhrbacteria bacterium]
MMMNFSEWRFSFEIAWDDPWYKWQSILTILVLVVGSFFVLWKLIPVGMENGLLVLHYNLYLGIDEVHHWAWVIVGPIAVLFIVLLNLIISFRLYRHDKIASRVLLCAATIFVIFMSIAAHLIGNVNA